MKIVHEGKHERLRECWSSRANQVLALAWKGLDVVSAFFDVGC
jgi:hypothetical protein